MKYKFLNYVRKSFYYLPFLGIISCLGTLEGCGNSTLKIYDYYEVKAFIDIPNIKTGEILEGENLFYCKLGFENSPLINNVKIIEWNSQSIKIQTFSNSYYILVAKKNKLCCGCNDILIGPLTKNEFKKKTIELNIDKELTYRKKL